MEPAPFARFYPPCFTLWRASGARLSGAGKVLLRPRLAAHSHAQDLRVYSFQSSNGLSGRGSDPKRIT